MPTTRQSALEDAGFTVNVVTTPVTGSSQDGKVLAQSPSSGQAAEGLDGDPHGRDPRPLRRPLVS